MAELLDATIVIGLSRKHPGALAHVGTRPGRDFLLHPVVAAEVLFGAINRDDLRRLDDLIARFQPITLVQGDIDQCLSFVRRYTLSHTIGWPDCLIAATALRLGVPVVTINDKHFRPIRGLKVIRPY